MVQSEIAFDDDPEPTQLPMLVKAFLLSEPVHVINAMIEYGVFQNLGVRLVKDEDNS